MGEFVIAKYIRLSTDDSYSDSMSIENQRLLLEKYITDMDIPNARTVEFVDNGYSGTNFERPGVSELLDLVRAGKINCIVVKDFSRFGRNAIETGYFLERVFPLYRTRFISMMDYYDSDNHEGGTGGIEVALKFLVHEQYSRDLSKKIKAAKRERMIRGEYVIKNCAFGYVKTKDNRLDIDPDAADTVRLIFALASEGKSVSEISRELYEQKRPTPSEYAKRNRRVTSDAGFNCIWGSSVIRKILSDEQYTGTYVAGKSFSVEVGSKVTKMRPETEWIRIPGHHPAIMSVELFSKVQAIISERRERRQSSKRGTSARDAAVRQSPLKGKVVCGCCGHAMALSTAKSAAFECRFTRAAQDAQCHGLRILGVELESALYEIISKQAQIALNVDSLSEVNAATLDRAREADYERSLEQAADAKHDLYERFALGEVDADEYMCRKAGIDAELDRLHRAYVILSEQTSRRKLEEDTNARLRDAVSRNGGLTRSIVDALVDKVRIFPDKRIAVSWKVAGV